MFKAFPLLRSNRLQEMAAFGLSGEVRPFWPLPLPERLPHDKDKKHTLILDIDETLIRVIRYDTYGKDLVRYEYIPRPYLKEFLLEARKLFEVVMWTAGIASYCAAFMDSIERDILELPTSFYNAQSLLKAAAGKKKPGKKKHANFYALSRTQTLQDMSYMKYIPLLGRPEDRVFMIDDNERSFPLTPRHGVKVSIFRGDQEDDDALLQLIPLLQAVAKSENAARELDYWRTDDYIKCDNFKETMDTSNSVRRNILGVVDLSKRREDPIPPLRMNPSNHKFVEAVEKASKSLMKPPGSKL